MYIYITEILKIKIEKKKVELIRIFFGLSIFFRINVGAPPDKGTKEAILKPYPKGLPLGKNLEPKDNQ